MIHISTRSASSRSQIALASRSSGRDDYFVDARGHRRGSVVKEVDVPRAPAVAFDALQGEELPLAVRRNGPRLEEPEAMLPAFLDEGGTLGTSSSCTSRASRSRTAASVNEGRRPRTLEIPRLMRLAGVASELVLDYKVGR